MESPTPYEAPRTPPASLETQIGRIVTHVCDVAGAATPTDLMYVIERVFRCGSTLRTMSMHPTTLELFLKSRMGKLAEPVDLKTESGRPTYMLRAGFGNLLVGPNDTLAPGWIVLLDPSDLDVTVEAAAAVIRGADEFPLEAVLAP